MQLPILSILIFLPIVGIGILLILDRKRHKGSEDRHPGHLRGGVPGFPAPLV